MISKVLVFTLFGFWWSVFHCLPLQLRLNLDRQVIIISIRSTNRRHCEWSKTNVSSLATLKIILNHSLCILDTNYWVQTYNVNFFVKNVFLFTQISMSFSTEAVSSSWTFEFAFNTHLASNIHKHNRISNQLVLLKNQHMDNLKA